MAVEVMTKEQLQALLHRGQAQATGQSSTATVYYSKALKTQYTVTVLGPGKYQVKTIGGCAC